MKKPFLLTLCFLFLSFWLRANEIDPLKVEVYKLSNGLTVMLNVDRSMPTVQGLVVVKGGSKRDPKDATGIAHYFEHIMFKGTDSIGTLDYTKEKVYLDSISLLYDKLAEIPDPKERLEIQMEINRLSIESAKYAIPNEVDRILNDMGGSGLNAGTGYESIVYFNTFPSNQIEKWLHVYYERFRNPVFRLFQSELETVYEEKNMYEDSPFGKIIEEIFSNVFPGTPYEIPIIGFTEHLKNPSLRKMEEYFRTYYVGNNMALVLSGDFDPEFVKPIIEDLFSKLPAGEVPKPLNIKVEPFKGRKHVEKRLTPVKIGILGFHGVAKNHPDELALDICNNILVNQAESGLLNQLSHNGKILFASSIDFSFEEAGGLFIIYMPKIVGQSLTNAEKLVLEQIQRLKSGDFDETLFQAVKTEMKVQFERSLEDIRWRAQYLADCFVYGYSWEDMMQYPQKIDQLKKEDVVAVANRYFTDNYLSFHSKMGRPKKDKIEKPPFKQVVPQNTDKKSEYTLRIEAMPTFEMEPKFIEFGKDVIISSLPGGGRVFVGRNPINSIFTLRIVFRKGKYDDPLAQLAGQLMDKCTPLGTSLAEFKKKLQALGVSYYVSTSLNTTTLEITGLEENFDKVIAIFNELLQNSDLEPIHIKQYAQAVKMQKQTVLKDIASEGSALIEYVKYGPKSSYLSDMTDKEIRKTSKNQVLSKIKEIVSHTYDIHYVGKMSAEELITRISTQFKPADNVQTAQPNRELTLQSYREPLIYVYNDPKAIQSHLYFYVLGDSVPKAERAKMDAFNEYIGGNMSSIIFQEIREFRSLAYGASGHYYASPTFNNPGYFSGWLSTQSDKTIEAVETFVEILRNMPAKPDRIPSVRKGLTLTINAEQPQFRYMTTSVANWVEYGWEADPRKVKYPVYQNITFNDIEEFYKKYVAGRPIVVVVAGDAKRFNIKDLEKIGKVKTIEVKTFIK